MACASQNGREAAYGVVFLLHLLSLQLALPHPRGVNAAASRESSSHFTVTHFPTTPRYPPSAGGSGGLMIQLFNG